MIAVIGCAVVVALFVWWAVIRPRNYPRVGNARHVTPGMIPATGEQPAQPEKSEWVVYRSGGNVSSN